ncbi:hypothetical protein P7H38_10755 [Lactococcus raffinolactis]|nr:hypothetical protein [Lactococcus raffinolactis]MDT2767147.1 hypothetical protein [Lactococcus raffinolactis]MDT2790280.1 hypothetical protein [Lactococcus raffinolactis]
MKKGQLKIYFGYAAGVGKTFAMLEGALEAQESGIDVVSASPSASHVIHAAARLTVAFKAEFTALYIGDLENSSKEEKDRLRQNLRLAERFCCKV